MVRTSCIPLKPTSNKLSSKLCLTIYRSLASNTKLEVNEKYGKLIFVAPNQRPVRLLKKFSITTSTLGLVALPTFHYAQIYNWFTVDQFSFGLAGLALVGSLASTWFMHWFCSPYVTRLYIDSSTSKPTLDSTFNSTDLELKDEPILLTPNTQLTLITTSLLGNEVITQLKLNQLVMGKLPHVTWRIHPSLLKKLNHTSLERELKQLDLPKFNRTKFWIDMPQNYNYVGKDTVMQVNSFIYQLSR